MAASNRDHHEIQELVPWYVNGTLAEREMDRVTEHIDLCPECARAVDLEFAMARRIKADPFGLQEILDERESAFDKLRSRLPAAQTPTSRWNRPAMAAVLALVAVLAFSIGRLYQTPAYKLMTDSHSTDSFVVQLIFHPQASEQEIRHLLVDGNGELLGSPSSGGVYRIALPPGSDARAYATRIREHPAVRWAEVELR